MAEGFEQIFNTCGIRPRPGLVSELVRKDRELLGAAVFIDDQPANCVGAAALGVTALQIARDETSLLTPAPGTLIIRSLLQAATMF